MGVKGLWQLLEPVGKPVTLESLQGKVLAVDASILMNQAVKGMRDGSGNPVPNAHLFVLFHRLCKLLFYRVKPVFVFDGGVPVLKKKTLEARRERRFKAKHGSNKAAEKIIKNFLKGKAIEAVTGKKSDSTLRGSRSAEQDLFELPPLPEHVTGDGSSSDEEADDSPLLQQYLSQNSMELELQDPSAIDVNSEDFKSLPEEIQHELIVEMKESRRWTFHKDMPDEATDFSSFQLQGVLQRGRLTQKLGQLRKDMTMRTSGEVAGIAGKGSVQSSRIVSEDTGHYVLVKGPKSDHAQGSLIDNSTEGGFFREEEDDKIATNIYPKYLEKASKPSTVPVPTFEVPHIESSDSEATSPFVEVPEASFRFQSDGTTCHQAKEMTEQYIPSDQPSCENDDLTVNGEIAKRRNRIEAPLKSTDLRVNVENVSTKKGESQDNKPVSMEKESDLDSIKQSKDGETNITVTTVTAFFNDKQKPKSSAEAEDLSVNIADGMVQKDGAINIELNESSCRNDETSKDVASNVLFENNENSSKLSNGGSYEAEVFSLHLESSTASSESSDGEPVPQQRTGARFDREVNEFITPQFIDQKNAANSDIVASAGNSIVDEAESAFDKPPVAFAVRNQEDVASSNAAPTEILTEDSTKTAEICMIESDSEPETHGSAVAAEISIDANKPASRRPSISRPVPEQSEFAGVSKRDLEEMQTKLNREQRTLQSERARQARASAEVSTEMLNESQELLRLFGVPFLVSPMEAEAQCAFLDMTGQTDGTITDDSDVFLFGGRRVYKNIFNQNKHAECYTCEDIDKGLALSRSKMIKLAFVTGSDYTEGIQGLGAVSAMEVLHEFSQDGFAALKELRKWYDEALDNGVTKHETKIKTKLRTVALPTGFPSREVYDAYTDPVVDESRDRFEWARPDLHEIRMFASDKLGWTSKRTDELMLPVMKELNKNEEDPKALALKENLRSLKTSFSKICDLFEKIVDFNHNPTSESAKRRLDLEIDRLKALKEQCESADPAQVKQLSSEDVPEYDKYYILHVNSILSDIKSIRTDLVGHIQEKTEAEENIAKENFKLRLDLQREQAESMHQRQNHDYAVTEKNTVLATCRKLEEQLDERSRQIQQLQREGTVSLWQREKAKVVQDIKSNEEQLGKELKELKEQSEDTKLRLNRRVQELTEQVKFLKMEKDLKNGTIRAQGGGGNVSQAEMEKMRQQLFMKDRSLVVAEGELQRQQKYYIGFISGLSRDFRVMLERQHLTVKEYNKDQKAFASMLNKMYVAVKEGTLTDFRATLPSHYLGINVELAGHPLGKKVSRPFMDLEKHLEEIENSGIRTDFEHPLLTGWREGKNNNDSAKKGKSAQITGVHPQLVDMASNKPLIKETMEHFPEWSAKEIEDMFMQFKVFDTNDDFHLDTQELLRAIPDTLGRMATTEEIKEAMLEVDVDSSGTVDFFEFLCVARLITQGKGEARLFKKKTLTALRKKSVYHNSNEGSKLCVVQ